MLFQPHRFTRTQSLWDDFCRCFNQADVLVLTDIYPASEAPIAGVTAERLAEAIHACGHKNVRFSADMEQAAEMLRREARPGDAVLTMGAGSVGRIADEIFSRHSGSRISHAD
jgi:UDP-N-acetylmuramate--alanine ligase